MNPEPTIHTTTTVRSTFELVLYKMHLEKILREAMPSIPAEAELTIETYGGGSYCGNEVALTDRTGLRVSWTTETLETT
jgi:hypothetical protein